MSTAAGPDPRACSPAAPAAESAGLAGIDATWLATHGANAAWRYARSVQSALIDLRAAWAAEDWELCVEACAQALRGIVVCEYCLSGLRTLPERTELHLLLAVDRHPAAAALRSLPDSFGAPRTAAAAARDAALGQVAALHVRLPILLPVIREADAQVPTGHATAQIARFRATRGLGSIDWDRSGL